MLNIAVENEKRIRSFCYPEYLSLIFFNYFSTTSFAIALKVFSSGRKRIFCSWKVSKFLHAASFANARKVNVGEFQVKN